MKKELDYALHLYMTRDGDTIHTQRRKYSNPDNQRRPIINGSSGGGAVYSPYDSNGNTTSYNNSSYQSGKAPSPDAPRIEELNEQQAYYCSIANRVPNTNALGAGNYENAIPSLEDIEKMSKIIVESSKYVGKSIEFSLGVGQGIGASTQGKLGPDSVGVSLQYSSNYIEIRVDDGNVTWGRSISAEAYLELLSGKIGFAKKELDALDQKWVPDNENSFIAGQPVSSIGIDLSAYFIIGASFDLSLNLNDLVKQYPEFSRRVMEIINEK